MAQQGELLVGIPLASIAADKLRHASKQITRGVLRQKIIC